MGITDRSRARHCRDCFGSAHSDCTRRANDWLQPIVITCAIISICVAVATGIALFGGSGGPSRVLEVLFATSVGFFLGSLVSMLSRRAALHVRDQEPPNTPK